MELANTSAPQSQFWPGISPLAAFCGAGTLAALALMALASGLVTAGIYVLLGAAVSGLGLFFHRQRRRLAAEITARRSAEEALAHARAEMEQCLDALRRAERRLAEQDDQLARSRAEVFQFADAASHHFDEPLRMVANFTQLLADRYAGKLDQDARDFIGYALAGARRAQTLLHDLLALSRVATRGRPFTSVPLEDALSLALSNLQFAIEESQALITYDELPEVYADSSQLIQLFHNLIANSIKFRGPRPPRIHISATPGVSLWTFSVRDNGIGFEPQHAERIFAVFHRLHPGGGNSGTGIGLAICRRIVERHHGKIWAESTPGEGSTFHFTLPDSTPSPEPRQAA